jgi:hypothetical protein
MEKEAVRVDNSRRLSRVIKSDSFTEKALFLVMTAVLSGAVIPFIVKSVDRAREERAEIVRAQAALFDDISDTLLTMQTLLLDVSYFGKIGILETQTKAYERYSERSVDLIAKWRVQSSRALALASPDIAQKLLDFQLAYFSEQDGPTNTCWRNLNHSCNWSSLHETNERMLGQAYKLTVEIAQDFGIVGVEQ